MCENYFCSFVPIIASFVISSFGLIPKVAGYFGGYSRDTSAQISTAFATAAGLFYHGLWRDEIISRPKQSLTSTQPLSKAVYRPDWMRLPNFVEGMIRSAAEESPTIQNQYLSRELTENFLPDAAGKQANDLGSVIIQMGRDAGLRKYTEWRVSCGLSPIVRFNDLVSVAGMEPFAVALLGSIYS